VSGKRLFLYFARYLGRLKNKNEEKTEETGGKVIRDLTEEVMKRKEIIYNFPSQVDIVSAKLTLEPNDYYFLLRCKIDGQEYEIKRRIYSNLTNTIREVLFDIKDSYEATHIIQQ